MASGEHSHAEGLDTDTRGRAGAHIMGRFGDSISSYSWALANGTSPTKRGSAARILKDGRGIADQGWFTGAGDYAEMFETIGGALIDAGYFVTLDGEKVRTADPDDDFILGVTSARPGILADAAELRWKGKYLTDAWGRVRYEKVTVPGRRDKEDRVVSPARDEEQPMHNPEWDSTRDYIPRSERPEWTAVALLGKVLMRDDGSCQVNGYCRPAAGGVATSAKTGYRVMRRTADRQILILLR